MGEPTGGALVRPEPPPKPAPLTEAVSVAVAAQAKAAVEARYLMALRQPRNWLDVRSKLLEACHRPAFAAAARYRKPIGGSSVEGASIRFVEEALRAMGNVYVEKRVIYDDETQRIVLVSVTDLEANLSYPTELHIQKVVERKKPREGQDILGSRLNTQGGTVYLVRATEDELVTKEAALVSKAIRTNGERLIPSDIKDEAMDVCIVIEKARDAEDPKAALHKIADAFDSIAVRPLDLEAFLGHPLHQTSPAEIGRLRAFWRAIEEGEATWADIVATKGASAGPPKDKGAAALKEAVTKRDKGQGAGTASQAAAEAPADQPPPTDEEARQENLALDQQIAAAEAAEPRRKK